MKQNHLFTTSFISLYLSKLNKILKNLHEQCQTISNLKFCLINVSFIPFFFFDFWSLLANGLQKYENITKEAAVLRQET